MDPNCLVLHIMTDIRSSRSSIAANFQNAVSVQLLPPIGVFWDIENVHVPKGKAAGSVVNAIREKFFKNHREAEFMCVCDINKESKAIVHELNDAQVTVVHVDATSKNAADEKLRQCMRRFVDTHGSPSTILLISDDVNFATDLSDFRHRHQVRIILLHRNQAPEPLLACANEHYSFSELTGDLPMRSPAKLPNNRPRDVIVTDLPSNCTTTNLKKYLRRMSDNCGGKVKCISKTEAIVSFANADSAERAKKRMDKELVCGQRISVNFLLRDGSDWHDYNSRRTMYKESNPTCSSSSASSRDSSPQITRSERQKNDRLSEKGKKASYLPPAFQEKAKKEPEKGKEPFVFPPPPVLDGANLPAVLKSPEVSRSLSLASEEPPALTSKPSVPPSGTKFELLTSHSILTRAIAKSDSMGNVSCSIIPTCSAQMYSLGAESGMDKAGSRKTVGRVSPFLMQKSNSQSAWQKAENGEQQQKDLSFQSVQPRFSTSQADSLIHGIHCFQPVNSYQNFNFGLRSSDLGNFPCYNPSSSALPCYSRNNQFPPPGPSSSSSGEFSPVELFITNLDQSIDVNEMKKILQSIFREHVMVLHISMILQPDGSPKAIVKVPSYQDAQLAIANIQRRKIGHKRIQISHASSDRCPPFHILKSEVVSLLKDIPTKRLLPVFKFRELYESRYHRAISVSDLYRMRDVVHIQDDVSGRTISLNVDYCSTPSPTESESSQELPALEKPYCERHFHPPATQGWAEQESMPTLPDVVISLRTLSLAVHTLLDSHLGSLPLISFCACYEADIGPLPVADTLFEDGGNMLLSCSVSSENRTVQSPIQKGVPLEHLIACVAGVEIVKSKFCVKKVQWCENKVMVPLARSISPALAGPVNAFGREIVELLKNQPRSMIPFNKFIPIYHHHFGKQCRVSDYGFTKLIDLLEALSHIVQVLGEGQNRQVTLTHRTQVKRFVTDLLRILKSRPNKQVALHELPSAYQQCLERAFSITNYGVCDVEDLLIEIPENTVVVTSVDKEKVISLPKRDQTPEEFERTKKFSEEVVELLKHAPACSMMFNKFIPAYHHHFGKQCRVADYGFTKLIELFEAIRVVDVSGTGEEKLVTLVEEERKKVVAERLTAVLKAQPNNMIALQLLGAAYVEMHGHILHPSDYGADDMTDLLRKLNTSLRVVEGFAGSVVTLIDKEFIRQASLRTRRILMEQPDGELPISEVNRLYQKRFGHVIDISMFSQELKDVVKVESGVLKLPSLQLLARDMIVLLQEHDKPIPMSEFEAAFFKRFKARIEPTQHGFSSLATLLSSLNEYFIVRGRRQKRTVSLNKCAGESPLRSIPETSQDGSCVTLCEDQTSETAAPTTTAGVVSSSLFNHMLESDSRIATNFDLQCTLRKGFTLRRSEGILTPQPMTSTCTSYSASYKPVSQPLVSASSPLSSVSKDLNPILPSYDSLISFSGHQSTAAVFPSSPLYTHHSGLQMSLSVPTFFSGSPASTGTHAVSSTDNSAQPCQNGAAQQPVTPTLANSPLKQKTTSPQVVDALPRHVAKPHMCTNSSDQSTEACAITSSSQSSPSAGLKRSPVSNRLAATFSIPLTK